MKFCTAHGHLEQVIDAVASGTLGTGMDIAASQVPEVPDAVDLVSTVVLVDDAISLAEKKQEKCALAVRSSLVSPGFA